MEGSVDSANIPDADVRELFELRAVLGSGGYAVVYRAHRRSDPADAADVALKVVFKQRILNKARVESEINALASVNHKSIVRLYETHVRDNHIYLVMEYCEGGCLFDRLLDNDENGGFPEIECVMIMKQVLEAIAYLHSSNIVHRDLKLENILLARKDSNTDIKLTDFGVVRILQDSQMRGGRGRFQPVITSHVGSVAYMAPEIFLGQPYDQSVDLWSAGVFLYMLLSLSSPFGNDGADTALEADQIKRIVDADFNFNANIWKRRSNSAKNLIVRLLKKNPYDRLSAQEALQHAWIKQLDGLHPKAV